MDNHDNYIHIHNHSPYDVCTNNCPEHNDDAGFVDHQPHHNPGAHINDNRPTVIVYRDDFDDLVAALALDDDANRYLHLYAAATNLTAHTPTTPGDGITR